MKMRSMGALGIAASLLLTSACGTDSDSGSDDADWPTKPVTLVVPFGVGGGADTSARALADSLQDELGVPIVVENRDGASGEVGHRAFLAMQPDCGHWLYSALTPYLPQNILLEGDDDFTLDKFEFVNIQVKSTLGVWVNAKSKFQTMDDLVDAIQANPGEVSVGVPFGGPGHVATVALMEALGMDPKTGVNIVLYDGGGDVTAAIGGNQVDFTIAGMDNIGPSLGDKVRALATFSTEPVAFPEGYEDVPLINDVLADHDAEVSMIGGSAEGLAALPKCHEDHPERFDKFVDAYKTVIESDEFQARSRKAGILTEWIGPEESTTFVHDQFALMEKYTPLLDQG